MHFSSAKPSGGFTMENGSVENGVCSSESVNGSRDIWSCKDSDSLSVDHLVVMVHGILGSTTDWKFAAEQFVKVLPDKVFVHRSERNVSRLTLDGVDVMGERLAEEVIEVIRRRPNLCKISFVAHSVGGLVARYAIGRLYRPPNRENMEDSSAERHEGDSRGTIAGLKAMNFITVATPHLGSRGNKQVPFLFGVPAFEKVASSVIHLIFRRTGQHLFLTDADEGKPPLLKCMIEDYGLRCVHLNVGWHIQMWATTISWAGEHHVLGVIVICQSGRVLVMKTIRTLYLKSTARLMTMTSVSLLQLKMMDLTS
ncbi:hypothetical protein F2P56_017894 [Juglans regia]|uniref:DUF676 domain-containing protein n=1 Tax=Juglans regia TaxID=51240 RepID=A0A833XAQ5_JUGRE|nr:hypothetical protein F2P56_017894 [Juglans regia]